MHESGSKGGRYGFFIFEAGDPVYFRALGFFILFNY